MSFRTCVFALGALLLAAAIPAQVWSQPRDARRDWHFGISGGAGGQHYLAGVSADAHWQRFSFRLAPGLFYLSPGASWQFGPKYLTYEGATRRFYLGLYGHYAWLLGPRLFANPDQAGRFQIHSLLGYRQPLNPTSSLYLEAGAGLAYQRDWFRGETAAANGFFPMVEVRIGGIFRQRKFGRLFERPAKKD
jgi:hypothetical protein